MRRVLSLLFQFPPMAMICEGTVGDSIRWTRSKKGNGDRGWDYRRIDRSAVRRIAQ